MSASRVISCARTAETHSVLALSAAQKGDYVGMMEAALNARVAADEAVRLANQVLPVNAELREIANQADLDASKASSAVQAFESRSRKNREQAIAPILGAIRAKMPGIDAKILEDSQASAAWDAVREALLLLQYRMTVKE